MNRDERQEICINKWKENKGRGIMLLCTGFGKTRTALKICERLVKQKKDAKIIVIVPSDNLRTQWLLNAAEFGLHFNVMVDTVQSLVTKEYDCDFLIADEIHMYASDVFFTVFSKIRSRLFLGLTGTLVRLDGKEKLLYDIAPVVDEIHLEEAIRNKWVSDYIQYKVELDVDLTEYHKHSAVFNKHFAYFGNSFDLAMAALKHRHVRLNYASQTGKNEKEVMLNALGFSRGMRGRKSFIYDHPRKIELADMIVEHRSDRKIIVFTKSVAHAKLLKKGELFHAGIKPKSKKDIILKTFIDAVTGILNVCKAVDVGTDIPGVSVGVMMSGDSASNTKNQRMGRILRYSEGKVAELWCFVIKGTAEETWFNKANGDKPFVTIQENQLEALLKGEDYSAIKEETPFLYIL